MSEPEEENCPKEEDEYEEGVQCCIFCDEFLDECTCSYPQE